MLPGDKIATSESKYKKLLRDFFGRVYDISFLPSHGLGHHDRVWKYAAGLLMHHPESIKADPLFTDKLIIACYLHDVGMAVDPGFRHGKEGMILCRKFLEENNLPENLYSDVPHAVENHDNKEYKGVSDPASLITLLTVADDLDAFGYAGIHRYLEIYIARSKPMNKLGDLILENSAVRFNHFRKTYGLIQELAEKHSSRYELLRSFFSSYRDQSVDYKFDNEVPSGHCGVAQIVELSLSVKDPEAAFLNAASVSKDPIIRQFLDGLKSELQ